MKFLDFLSTKKRVSPLRVRLKKVYPSPLGQQCQRLCVFAHNDRWNRIDDHVLHYLRSLRKLGLDVLFVTTSNSINKEDLPELLKECFEVWVRPNVGYDFGSYQAGLARFATDERYQQVILANDSVYGPLRSLEKVFKGMEARNLDVWGMTDSLQHEYHLQSYFLVLNRKALDHHRMKEFWFGRPFKKTDKREIVKLCEIAFSRICKKSSLSMGAWSDCRRVTRAALEDSARRLENLRQSRNGGVPYSLSLTTLSDVLAEDHLREFALRLLTVPCNPTHELWNLFRFRRNRPKGC